MKKVLVLGGTGAMGRYLVPELLELGYEVDVVSLDDVTSDTAGLNYIKANVKDDGFLSGILKNKYDGVVDFMTYSTEAFRNTYKLFLENTDQYIFLSSCRVYADSPPIREDSPRLLDVSEDEEYLKTDDYSLYKARQENMLRESGFKNWTIVRPATTYSTGRLQLVTLEAHVAVYRMLAKKKIVLPVQAMDKQATLSWGGDVGRMIARLMFKKDAMADDFIVSTGEHHSWKEIAEIYNEICPFEYVAVDKEDYLEILSPEKSTLFRYQLELARMFQRITDNSKILRITGMKQEELMGLKEGLRMEFERTDNINMGDCAKHPMNLRMDKYLSDKGL